MKRLNGWDAMLLYSETPNIHTHTLKIGVIDAAEFDGDFTFEVFRRTLRRRLHLLEPLRYRLIDIPLKLHHPMWLEKSDIDLNYHLRRVRVRRPGGRRELNEVIGEIASTPLDRSRPLWEMYFAEGMADNRFAVIGKVHHALADGVASANLMAKAMDLKGPIQDERDLYATNAPPSTGELLAGAWRDHMKQLGRLPRLARETAAGISRVRARGKERGDAPGTGEGVLAAADVLQPRRVARSPVRHGHPGAVRRQGDQQASWHHDQRPRCSPPRPVRCESCCCATTVAPMRR